MKEKMGALSYQKHCQHCMSIIRITVDELNFDGVTVIGCPVCGASVRFTGDFGSVLNDVKTSYEGEFKQFYGRARKKNQRRPHQADV